MGVQAPRSRSRYGIFRRSAVRLIGWFSISQPQPPASGPLVKPERQWPGRGWGALV